MRKFVLLCAVMFLSSVAAVAQSDISTIAAPAPAAAIPASPQISRPDLTDWQISLGYQFTRFNMPAEATNAHNSIPAFSTNDHGINVSFTRFLVDWGGLEVESVDSWGSTTIPQIPSAHSIFIGGGPRFAYRGHGRFEPWAHILIGLDHFRFSQTSSAYGSNNSVAFVPGGGLDWHLNVRTAIRLQGDFVATDLFKFSQKSWDAGAGVVFNF